MILYPLLWDGIPPPNNEHAIGSLRPDQKKHMNITLNTKTMIISK